MPRFFRPRSTSAQDSVDSRYPSAQARSSLLPSAFTPITTRQHSRSSSRRIRNGPRRPTHTHNPTPTDPDPRTPHIRLTRSRAGDRWSTPTAPGIGPEEPLKCWGEITRREATQIQDRQHVAHLGRPTRILGQNIRAEPVPLPTVIDPRGPNPQRTSSGHQRPLPSSAVAYHQPIPSLIDQLLTGLDVSGDLRFEAGHQHPPRPLRHQIVEHSAQIVAVGDISDYLQHEAYSFPAGQTPAEPITRSGRVRRPSIRIPSSTTIGYSSPPFLAGAFAPAIKNDLGIGTTGLGVLFSIGALTSAASLQLGGSLADRRGARRGIRVGRVLTSIGAQYRRNLLLRSGQ